MDVEVTLDNKTYVSLAFASKNLPDLLLCQLTTADIVRYGQDEGQLIPWNNTLNDTYMPNLNRIFNEHPEWLSLVSTSDGMMYSAPRINDTVTITGVNLTGSPNYMINQTWLNELNLKAPTNLDDLLTVLRAFKTMGDKVVPLGGGYEAVSPGYYLLNAFGYLGTDTKGFQVCTRNGKVVFPFGDREVFGEYLKLMHQLYQEQLISPDYFTLDATAIKAQLAENLIGIYPGSASTDLSDAGDFKNFWGAAPLTSPYNAVRQWKQNSNGITIGQCSLSSTCAYPEAASRFVDWFYEETSSNYLLAWIGPSDQDKHLLYDNMISGYTFVPETGARNYVDVKNGRFASAGECVKGSVAGFTERFGYAVRKTFAGYNLNGMADRYVELVYDANNATQGWHWSLYSVQENLMQYLKTDYPHIIFLNQEDNTDANDLKVALESYATQEIAKFIIGERALTDQELSAYFNTLQAMGFDDYLAYYADYYANLQ
jgi:hypothetical protein